jgi:type II secretory pathway pseudopilin PulG
MAVAGMRFKARGFTYLGLLILVAILGIASVATIKVGALAQRRSAEEQLLYIGSEFQNAFASYAGATPTGQSRLPHSLQDLLKDPRYPNIRRHLRKMYVDPLTGKEEWGLVTMPGIPGIAGVYSLSEDKPIKVGSFDVAFQHFKDKESYREWQFGGVVQASQISP